MAYCFSFMFQFDGQDVLVPYTHYQRNKGIGSKYYLRGTIYSVRSNELTMQNARIIVSCALTEFFSGHFILRSLALKQKNSENKNKTRNGKGKAGGRVCVSSYSRKMPRSPPVRPAWLIKPQNLLTCFSQSNGGTAGLGGTALTRVWRDFMKWTLR